MTRNVASALKLARGRSVDLPLANEYAVIKIKIYARPHLPRHKHRQIKTLTSRACRATSKVVSQHPNFRSLIINCYVAIRILPTEHLLLSFDRFLITSLFATYRNAAWFTVLKQMFQGHNSMTNPALPGPERTHRFCRGNETAQGWTREATRDMDVDGLISKARNKNKS